MSSTTLSDRERIAWPDFVKFVRQLTHDLRNQLNAAELQSALLSELSGDPETKAEADRLREIISRLGKTLRDLSASVSEPRPNLIPYSASMFFADLRQKIAERFPKEAAGVVWEDEADGGELEIDPTLLEWAMVELFDNAFRHQPSGKIAARVVAKDHEVVVTLREPKAGAVELEKWKPLSAMSHGHYRLGLQRVGRIASALSGRFEQRFEAGTLTTEVTLPRSTKRDQAAP